MNVNERKRMRKLQNNIINAKKESETKKNKSFDSGSSIDSLRLRCGQRGKALVCLSLNECQSVHCKQ